jgi:hypothetical protein
MEIVVVWNIALCKIFVDRFALKIEALKSLETSSDYSTCFEDPILVPRIANGMTSHPETVSLVYQRHYGRDSDREVLQK